MDQVTLLRDRGMDVGDPESTALWLSSVGYYRLSAYWLPLESPPPEGRTRSKSFVEGATFDQVTDRYVFDRKLRLLILEAIERIEIHVRSRWTYHLSHLHGAHSYLNPAHFREKDFHRNNIRKLRDAAESSDETFIVHYRGKYDDPPLPPIWAVTELMTLGQLSKWIAQTKDNKVRSAIARDLGLPNSELLDGILHAFSYVRNICAHHGRLWNKRLVKRIPNVKRWKGDLVIQEAQVQDQIQPDNRIYNVIVALLHLLASQQTYSTWGARVIELIETVSDKKREDMGFPEGWRERKIWDQT